MTGQGQAVHVSKCPKTGKDASMNDEHPGSHVPVCATSLDPTPISLLFGDQIPEQQIWTSPQAIKSVRPCTPS